MPIVKPAQGGGEAGSETHLLPLYQLILAVSTTIKYYFDGNCPQFVIYNGHIPNKTFYNGL